MLVRDTMTGYLHEVPESALYGGGFAEYPDQVGEGQVVFDGLGNPVGFLPFLPAIAGLASQALPAISGLLSKAAPAIGNLASQIPGMLKNIIPGAAGGAAAAGLLPAIGALPRPMPAGWQPMPLPYTGLGPKRLYMRCAVWPGPAGMVPTHAAAMQALPAVPVTPVVPALPAGPMVRRRRGRRR